MRKELKDFYGQSQLRKQKGAFAEDIVQDILEAKKWQIYKPPHDKYAHTFDFMALNWECKTLFIEVKAQRFKGVFCIKEHNYEAYKKIIEQYEQDFLLFVVNNNSANPAIFCTQFRVLLKPTRIQGKKHPEYKKADGKKFHYHTYWFSLDQFKKVRDLTKTELETLNKLSGG